MTLWPRTPVYIGGKRFDLCFTLGAVAEAQHAFDSRGIDVNLLESLPQLTLANVRLMLPFAVRKYHPGLDTGAAWALVGWKDVHTVAMAFRASWQAAAPIPEEKPKSRKRKKSRPEKDDGGGLTRDQQWQRLWSLAVYDLRLTTEQFYGLTVGQLDALIRRRERDIREQEFMPAQIAACIVNFSMSRPKEGVSAKDFMPSAWRDQPPAQPRMRSRKVIAKEIEMVMEQAMRYQQRQQLR